MANQLEQISRMDCATAHTHNSNCEECGADMCGCYALCVSCWLKSVTESGECVSAACEAGDCNECTDADGNCCDCSCHLSSPVGGTR